MITRKLTPAGWVIYDSDDEKEKTNVERTLFDNPGSGNTASPGSESAPGVTKALSFPG